MDTDTVVNDSYEKCMSYIFAEGLDKLYNSTDLYEIVKRLNEDKKVLKSKVETTSGNRIIGPDAHTKDISIVSNSGDIDTDKFAFDIHNKNNDPCHGLIDNMPRELILDQFKQFVVSHSKLNKNKEIDIKVHMNEYSKLSKDKIINSIESFMLLNLSEGVDNPKIIMNHDTKELRQSDIICKYVIPQSYPIKALRGEYGIKTKIFIPQYTILGQYIGIELTSNQFKYIYGGTRKDIQSRSYAFEAKFFDTPFIKKKCQKYKKNEIKTDNIQHEMKEDENTIYISLSDFLTEDVEPPRKRRKIQKEPDSVDEIICDYVYEDCITDLFDFRKNQIAIDYIVLDNFAIKESGKLNNLLAFINDARSNILNPEMNDDDRAKQNIEFIETTVNNWPSIFVITSKNIKRSSIVLGDYGPCYHGVVQEQLNLNSSIIEAYNNVKNEFRGVGIDLQESLECVLKRSKV